MTQIHTVNAKQDVRNFKGDLKRLMAEFDKQDRTQWRISKDLYLTDLCATILASLRSSFSEDFKNLRAILIPRI